MSTPKRRQLNNNRFISDEFLCENSNEDDFVKNDDDGGEEDHLEMEKEVSNTEEDGLNPSEFKELSDISDDDVSLAKIYFAKDKY